jgi:hypothetical protein
MARFSGTSGSSNNGGAALNYVQVEANQVNITTSPQEVASLTITTTGAPVQVGITGEGSNASAGSWVKLALYRGSTLIGQTIQIESSAISENVPYALNYIDDVVAGTYVYSAKIVGKSSGNWQFGEVSGPVMNAVELTGFNGADGEDGADGADGADGQYPNYLGEYNNGASYPIGGIVSIPVGSPYGNPGQLFIRATNPGNPGYPPGTESWTEYTNGLVVAGIPAFLPLTAFQEASNYAVDYGQFSHATYGNSIAIARTPQVDAYINYAISKGVPQSWTFKSFGEHASFTLTLGVPTPNVENVAPGKEIWTLEYDATAYGAIASGLTNGNEYGLYLTNTGPFGDTSAPTPISYTPVWSGTGLAQSSNLATGTYFDYGQMVVVQITVPMTAVTNFGTGAYSVTLPKQSALHANAWGGTVHHTDLNRFYSIKGHLEPNSNLCSLWFLNQSSQDQEFKATSPFVLTTTDLFHINFIYQANS